MRYVIPSLFIALGAFVMYNVISNGAFVSIGGLMSLAYGVVALLTGVLLAQRAHAGIPASKALKMAAWGVIITFVIAAAMIFLTISRIH